MKLSEAKQQTLDAIKDTGSTMVDVAKATGRTTDCAREHMVALERAGLVHRARVSYSVCYWFKDKSKAIACLQAHSESKKEAPLVTVKLKAASFERGAETVIPEGVKVQQCPGFRGLGFAEPDKVIGGFASMGVGRYLADESEALRRLARKAA